MATINIDTTSSEYQTRLIQLQQIKSFYGPRIAQYLKASPERQAAWRANDPILDEMLDIKDKIDERLFS